MATDKDTKPSWYQTDVKSINSVAQQLLESYSGPMRFLTFHHSRYSFHGRVGEDLRSNSKARFLDPGCCVRQEIRFLDPTGDNVSEALIQMLGSKINIMFAGSLLHLWNYETQLKATTRLARLLRDQVGVMVYRHNLESLKGLWPDMEQMTHTLWKVDALLEGNDARQI
ncbi:hypothetical protein BDW75DRAFT_234139 [Aspergillus navahoensis]